MILILLGILLVSGTVMLYQQAHLLSAYEALFKGDTALTRTFVRTLDPSIFYPLGRALCTRPSTLSYTFLTQRVGLSPDRATRVLFVYLMTLLNGLSTSTVESENRQGDAPR